MPLQLLRQRTVFTRKHCSNIVAGLPRLTSHQLPHHPVTNQCNLHPCSSVANLFASLTYSSTDSSSSRFEIFSCSVCASRIDPGPSNRGFPQCERYGMSVVKRTTHSSNPETETTRTGLCADAYSSCPCVPTASSRTLLTCSISIPSRICNSARARSGMTLGRVPPLIRPMLHVVVPKKLSSGQ